MTTDVFTPLRRPDARMLAEMLAVATGALPTDPGQAGIRKVAWLSLLEARRRHGSLARALAGARRAALRAGPGGAA